MRIVVRKYGLVWVFAALAMAAGALIAVNRAHASSMGFGIAEAPELAITVLDEATKASLPNAEIHVVRLTDDLRTVNVTCPGYGAVSIAGLRSSYVIVYLRPLPLTTERDVVGSGTFGGFGQAPSGTVQAGVVFKSLSAMDLLDFRFESFVSPLRDRIDVLGPREIPSNTVLPRQRVQLPIGSIALNKPVYRMPVPAGHAMRFAGVQGHIKVSDLLPIFQGGGQVSSGLLNKLQFTRVGLSSEFLPDADFTEDFDGVISLTPGKHQVAVDAPPFTSDVIVAAMTDLNGDRETMLPTDVKTAIDATQPGTIRPVSLSAPTGRLGNSRGVITVAVGGRGKRLTGIVTDHAGATVRPGAYLPVEEIPAFVRVPDSVRVRAPAHGVGFASFVVGGGTAWTLYVLPAAGEVVVAGTQLPPGVTLDKYSVSQLDFGPAFNERSIDGERIMLDLVRFTRASAKPAGLD